ncbi:UDP-glycosyltransferase 91C1-like [Tasmannia lanceolata]|uniref:UDP-glycosyltransferase 91C1-like n=1 Tax=Tasmannia lanceolata TaxID=3420 RepID=UPI004064973A
MDNDVKLHIVMFPWMAFGHMIPFLQLSKCLAKKGHHISFLSTPRNLQRLPKIPPSLSSNIDLVELHLPPNENLPENAEATADLPMDKLPYLKDAIDDVKRPLFALLERLSPDFIIHDFNSHWVPRIADKFGVSCVFFSTFNAAMLAFMGPLSMWLDVETRRTLPEHFTVPPKWIPFPSTVAYRLHELERFMQTDNNASSSSVSDAQRIGLIVQECQFIAIRSCTELEPDYLRLLEELHRKPVLPVGMLHPSTQEDNTSNGHDNWEDGKWLDEQERSSVVYVAFGTEVALTKEQVHEIAIGLEQSQLPFIWALRRPPVLPDDLDMLPSGFEDRIRGQGIIHMGWVAQHRILAHDSVGGFLTHAGWGSIVESLGFGKAMIMLPMIGDQPLNARLMEEKGIAIEVERNDKDGSFTRDGVCKALRFTMVEKEGEELRAKARDMRRVFGDKRSQGEYVDGFVRYLKDHMQQKRLS